MFRPRLNTLNPNHPHYSCQSLDPTAPRHRIHVFSAAKTSIRSPLTLTLTPQAPARSLPPLPYLSNLPLALSHPYPNSPTCRPLLATAYLPPLAMDHASFTFYDDPPPSQTQQELFSDEEREDDMGCVLQKL